MAEPKRIAVFIDAENIPANCADALFAEISKRGEISFCRAYGDFTAERMKAWEGKIKAHKVSAYQQDSVSNYKNAADISLVIGAMDVFHWKRAERFYIVSNDGDFTPLANRIKSAGLDVIGIGMAQASVQFQTACNDFVFLTPDKEKSVRKVLQSLPPPSERLIITEIVARLTTTEPDVLVSRVNAEIKEKLPGFSHTTYGHASISKLLNALNEVVLTQGNKRVRLSSRPPL